jgi:L-2-hydroxycarboxylate dehydrogenase (NAD+)
LKGEIAKREEPMTEVRTTVDADKLTDFVTRVLQKVDVPEEDARITANILVATDLRGIDSHGVGHLAQFYVRGIREGRTNPKPETKIFSQAPATAIMDGDRGLGFVVGCRAMMEAMRRAETTGAGFVSVRNSSHFGAGGNYAMMALSRNMIGVSMTVGGKGMVAPGSVGRGVTIDVISIAVPAKEEAPFVLDMATTVVASGKVEIANREGKTMPGGWAVDREGKPITDPRKYYEEGGALLPLGGTPQTGSYKGFGLAVAVDILCRILSGSMAGTQMAGSHFFGALSIDGFMPADEFKKAMDEMIREYRALPKAPGVERIYLAGEVEQEIEKQRRRDGIPLHPAIVSSLKDLAKELGIEYDL